MHFPLIPESPAPEPPGLADALGAALTYVGKGRFDHLVEVDSETTVRGLTPNFRLLAALPVRGVIVTSPSATPEGVVHAAGGLVRFVDVAMNDDEAGAK